MNTPTFPHLSGKDKNLIIHKIYNDLSPLGRAVMRELFTMRSDEFQDMFKDRNSLVCSRASEFLQEGMN